MSESRKGEAIAEARRLLRGARVGTLATAAGGQPFASLVTPACAPDLSPLLLLSGLSEHTRHLATEPRCALMVAGAPDSANPQTAPRVTVTGEATREEDPGLRSRWLAVHPYAGFYANFADFGLWRLRITGSLWVGGFGKAMKLAPASLCPDPDAARTVAEAEPSLLARWNAEEAATIGRIAEGHGAGSGAWRLVSLDVDGVDLALGEDVRRIAWEAPLRSAQEIEAKLAQLGSNTQAGTLP
ncbi:MAG: pyridoxamine 5'-phosphate oxidase family protein [Acetobacteraceae bacterium]|nr:pyridoxamine 5'-phosphate oxidase family protein [Acetobacteraceae bacterium]